jgi:hypothetical protein
MFYCADDMDRTWLWATAIFFNTTKKPVIRGSDLVEMLHLMESGNGVTPISAGMFLKRTGAFRRIRGHKSNSWLPNRRFKSLCEEELNRR